MITREQALTFLDSIKTMDREFTEEHHPYHWHEVDHQRPRHCLGGLTVVEHHVDDRQDGNHLQERE